MRDAVAATGRKVEEIDKDLAVRLGFLSSVQRLYRLGRLRTVSLNAAEFGQLEMLKLARANGALWDVWAWNSKLCAHAAKGGHLEVLLWARKQGCAWNEGTCTWAAHNGHLEVLQWARANGCPWNRDTLIEARAGVHPEVLNWAIANGALHSSFPTSKSTTFEGMFSSQSD